MLAPQDKNDFLKTSPDAQKDTCTQDEALVDLAERMKFIKGIVSSCWEKFKKLLSNFTNSQRTEVEGEAEDFGSEEKDPVGEALESMQKHDIRNDF